MSLEKAATEKITYFAEVILPLKLDNTFTYRVPEQLNDTLVPGSSVVVQFGSRKVLTGIVGRVHSEAPRDYQAKYILEQLTDTPLLHPIQLKFFRWMAEYYMCTIGEVLAASLPAAFKLSSQSKISIRPGFKKEDSPYPWSDKEERLLDVLEYRESLSYSDVEDILQVKTIQPVIKSLISKEAIYLFEQVKDKYRPKIIKKIRINPEIIQEEGRLQKWFEELERASKQQEVLIAYCSMTQVLQKPEKNTYGLEKSELLKKEVSESSLKTLVKKGVLQEFEQLVSRFEHQDATVPAPQLSEEQVKARREVLENFQQKNVTLLHGVTGSGKTAIYVDLIQESLDAGGQVLYLLPEIALTTQITRRLKAIFGDRLGIYHSKFSDNERAETWKGVLEGRYEVVVGVRSAIFLPFDNISLIIVDEEHEPSYKQFDPAPRYHARDSAIMLGHFHQAKVLLGTATPSVETYFQAQYGNYGLVELTHRYGGAQLPEIQIANLNVKKGPGSEFSSLFIDSIAEALQRKEQVIVFQNRRGYAHFVTCTVCGWVPESPECNVSLTYHQYRNELRCHYTGYKEKMPTHCPNCGSAEIKTIGFGTEQLEERLKLTFPEAIFQRMDLDTTRSKYSFQQMIESFEQQRIDILVGTQMVTKGLDFDNVTTVGIFDADRMMYFPDFRAHERTFQLLMQVSGRAGRKEKKGKVIIQTRQPQHSLFGRVVRHNYREQYEFEIRERERYLFPPYSRLIKITMKHQDKLQLVKYTDQLAHHLRKQMGTDRVLGPQEPVVYKLRGLYLMDIFIKLIRGKSDLKAAKCLLIKETEGLCSKPEYRDVRVVFDVDPV